MGPKFFETRMGQTFYTSDVPRIASALERIATALEKIADSKEAPAPEKPLGSGKHGE
jgi:hypothetical protein